MEPRLLEKAEYLCMQSAKLIGSYDSVVIDEIKELLRIINSYYSNKIESEGTHPYNIEQAMKKEFSDDSKNRQLQYLSIAYIDTQKYLEKSVTNSDINPYSTEFIKDVHKKLYSSNNLEEFLKIEDKQNNTVVNIIPGKFRTKNVKVGQHIPVNYNEIESMIKIYESLYKNQIQSNTKANKLIYALSSHHRLVWIHPFLDGNGRVSRLILDMLLHYIGIEGYGLWNISRGFARDNSRYKNLLAKADLPKNGNYDGRGPLSNSELSNLVHFMLDVAIDQIKYMDKQLKLSTLSKRLEQYIKNSQTGMYNIKPLPKHSEKLLKELLIKGKIKRAEVQHIIGTKDRVASSLIKELLEQDFIKSDTPRGDIRIMFNTHFAMKIFPELIYE